MMLSKTPGHVGRDAPNWIFLLGVIKQLQNGIFEKSNLRNVIMWFCFKSVLEFLARVNGFEKSGFGGAVGGGED